MAYFPLFIEMNNLPVLVVGAGKVAYRKVSSLLKYGAKIKVISPTKCEEFNNIISKIEFVCREFLIDDLVGMKMVIVATSNHSVNKYISDECKKQEIPINVVDVPNLCDFYFPGLIKRGNLVIGISTGGRVPYLAREIRKLVEDYFPSELDKDIERLGKLREKLMSLGIKPMDNPDYKFEVSQLIKRVKDGN